MCVADPIVSDEFKLRTKLLSFFIYALEKLREIVTASGRPSGIAQTITEIEMITPSSTFIQNLLAISNLNVSGTHELSALQLMMLPQPHGITLLISRIDRIIIEKNVRMAAKIPTYPIFSAITSSLS